MERETAYSLLGIPHDASQLDIVQAYRTLALKFHPSQYPHSDTFIQVHFRKLAQAYTTLIDPQTRAEYDRSLVQNNHSISHSHPLQSTFLQAHSDSRPRRNSYAGPGLPAPLDSRAASHLGGEFRATSHHPAPKGHPTRRHSAVYNAPQLPPRSSTINLAHSINRPSTSLSSNPSIPLPRTRLPNDFSNRPSNAPCPPPARPSSCLPTMPSHGLPSPTSSSLRSISSIRKTITRNPDGSVQVERVQQQRVIDDQGNVRDSFKRQRAGAHLRLGVDPSLKKSHGSAGPISPPPTPNRIRSHSQSSGPNQEWVSSSPEKIVDDDGYQPLSSTHLPSRHPHLSRNELLSNYSRRAGLGRSNSVSGQEYSSSSDSRSTSHGTTHQSSNVTSSSLGPHAHSSSFSSHPYPRGMR